MGGAVKAITSPANIIGSALGKVPVVGPVLGPAANIALGGNPFGAIAGGVFDAATGGFNSGGGGSSTPTYIQPGFNYGANTYTVGGKPYDTSKYFITGDKGVYNLMPELGNLYGNRATDRLPGATSYNVYNSIYNKMADDAAAQAAFAAAYGPKSYTPVFGNRISKTYTPPTLLFKDFTGPSYLQKDIQDAYAEQRKAYSRGNPFVRRPAFTPTPIQYSDFGFASNARTADNPFNALADYAAKQKNPFFVPFAPTAPAPTTAPVPTTTEPITSAPAITEPITPTPITPTPITPTPTPPVETSGPFRPVNIRTGGLATLRRSR